MGRAAPSSLTEASREEAARAYAVCVGLDPEGLATPDSVAQAGESFRLATEGGEVVYTLGCTPGGACWIHGAAGSGRGMTEAGLAVVEAQARAAGLRAVAFQTLRRGLVRKAQALGYRVAHRIGAGVILEKRIA